MGSGHSTVYAVTLASIVIYVKALTKLLASKVKTNCAMTEKDRILKLRSYSLGGVGLIEHRG